MEKELILLSEFCKNCDVDQEFLFHLENEGLIMTEVHDNRKYIALSQLNDLEMFIRLHYELSINVEGLDVIRNLLDRIRSIERELAVLRNQMNYNMFDDDF